MTTHYYCKECEEVFTPRTESQVVHPLEEHTCGRMCNKTEVSASVDEREAFYENDWEEHDLQL